MNLSTRLGLERGMHSKDGSQFSDSTGFINKLVDACGANDYLVVRCFSPSFTLPFDPRSVLIGVQYDEYTRVPKEEKGFTPRVRYILRRLATPESILVGEGSSKRPRSEDKSKYKKHFFYDFIGTHEVRFVDNKALVDVIKNMEKQGIFVNPDDVSRTIEDFLTPGIIEACRDVRLSGRVLVPIHINNFVPNDYILRQLERNNISYVLVCPRQLFQPNDLKPKYDERKTKVIYYNQLMHTAETDFSD